MQILDNLHGLLIQLYGPSSNLQFELSIYFIKEGHPKKPY